MHIILTVDNVVVRVVMVVVGAVVVTTGSGLFWDPNSCLAESAVRNIFQE